MRLFSYRLRCFILILNFFTSGLSAVEITNFIPFGIHVGDTRLTPGDDSSSNEINLIIPFHFANRTETNVFVNVNGGISFGQRISQYTPDCSPLPAQLRMIAAFWADIDTRSVGDIFYRQTTEAINTRKISIEIQSALTQTGGINIKWLFIVTWVNVTYFGAMDCYNGLPRNTFQAILASDGLNSYTIFYYNKITWTTGTASGGDSCSGLGGRPAKVGFDAGDGVKFFKLPESCFPGIVNLSHMSNINSPGKWIFQVDQNISVDMCSTEKYINGKEKVKITPNVVDLFGHVWVKIQGPCFNRTDNVTCELIDASETKHLIGYVIESEIVPSVIFYIPILLTTGRKVVTIVAKDTFTNTSKMFIGHIFVIYMESTSLSVTYEIQDKYNMHFNVSWNSVDLFNYKKQVIEYVDFIVMGRKRKTSTWQTYAMLKEAIPNNGRHVFQVNPDAIIWRIPTDDIGRSIIQFWLG